MIVTLTPNPSIDRTVSLTAPLERGAVLRAASVLSQSGGKGVNISRAAVVAGVPTIAVVPADEEDPYVLELLTEGVDCRPERPAGPVRMNLTITEPDGTTTKINSPGATVDDTVLQRLLDAVLDRADRASWVVLAGSLPPGAPDEWYARVVTALRDRPVRTAVDTSGAPLTAMVAALQDAAPTLMKPNGEELASLTGLDPESIEDDPREAARAASKLIEQGVAAVLATLGGNGAVLVTAEGAWHATPPPTTVLSTVGAGDSSLFGYLRSDLLGHAPQDRLRHAVAYGSAAAGLAGTTMPHPDQARPDLVHVTSLTLP